MLPAILCAGVFCGNAVADNQMVMDSVATKHLKFDPYFVEAYAAFQAECAAADMPVEEREKRDVYALDADGNAYSPAWFTINLRASLQVARGLSLNATLENIADKRYRPYSCGISAPGRNVTMSLTYDF